MIYDVAKEKGGRWYVCYADALDKPISGTHCKDKKDALHIAADKEGIPYKEYMKLRKSKT